MINLTTAAAPVSPLPTEMKSSQSPESPIALVDNELATVQGGGAIGVESGGTVLSPDGRVVVVDRIYRK